MYDLKVYLQRINNFLVKNAWQLIGGALVLSTIFSLSMNYYLRKEIIDLMKKMYYIEYIELELEDENAVDLQQIDKKSKTKREMVLEVFTNSFVKFDENKEFQQAKLYLKDGSMIDIFLDKEKSIFIIDTTNMNINKRVYKFNSTSKIKEMRVK